MRITIVTPSLSAGGAERSVVLLSEEFLKNGHAVTVVTLSGVATDSFKLAEGIDRVALDLAAYSPSVIHGLFRNLHRLAVLRRRIRGTHPQIVVSNMSQANVLTRLALANTRCPVVMVEHSDPAVNVHKRIWKLLRRVIYMRSAKLVSVSGSIDDYFTWLPKSRKSIIPNPVRYATSCSSLNPLSLDLRQNEKCVVAMGRLVPVKGFDLLLSAFAKVAQEHPDWHLAILGEGELKSELECLIARLNLKKRVSLKGFVTDPFTIFKHCEFFVMSSRSEGFPHALLEAMAAGLPAVATECTSGVSEIVRDGIDGILVPVGDVQALATAMGQLMGDANWRRQLAMRAPEVVERFGMGKIVRQWENLFASVVKDWPSVE